MNIQSTRLEAQQQLQLRNNRGANLQHATLHVAQNPPPISTKSLDPLVQ